MRSVDRITKILNEVERLWKKYPDLRFFQLVGVLCNGQDLFYEEDGDLYERLQQLIEL